MSRLEYYYEYLISDPVGFLIYMLYLTVTVLMSLILHEVSHGYIALRCGDPTAKMLGRLSLNPAKHLDKMGTIFMLIFGFGWAKPVPVNPRNFRNGRKDDFFVSIAGIMMNLTLFIVCTGLSVAVNSFLWNKEFLSMVTRQYGTQIYLISPYWNVGSMILGGSLDGGWQVFLAHPWLLYVQRFLLMMGQINLSLAVFNLLPIPPLDGYHLLNDTLLQGRFNLNRKTFYIAEAVLLMLCLSGVLNRLLSTINNQVYNGVLNLFLILAGGA